MHRSLALLAALALAAPTSAGEWRSGGKLLLTRGVSSVEGAAGGGLVKIRASAKGRVIGVSVDDSLLAPSEKGILEDLIAAAFNDARAKADNVASAELAKAQQGMGLPPGFKLPF